MADNRYIFYRNDHHQINVDFDPKDPTCLDQFDHKYFGRVLHMLEPYIRDKGLVFCVTTWTVHELPVYGPNVIACILLDEWARETPYRNKVGMIFRSCGQSCINPQAYAYGNMLEKISNFLGQSRALSQDKGQHFLSAIKKSLNRPLAPKNDIPLGYFANEDVSHIPIEERPYDLYFAGSIQHKKAIIKRPKEFARERMGKALQDLKTSHPALKIASSVTGGFKESIHADNQSYLQNMMNTKICPIPRGANLETYRYYEALRYGCIPIGEAFPNTRYFRDAPIIRLKDWSDMQDIVPQLLSNSQELKQRHQDALAWWKSHCCEQAVAQYMLQEIETQNIQ